MGFRALVAVGDKNGKVKAFIESISKCIVWGEKL